MLYFICEHDVTISVNMYFLIGDKRRDLDLKLTTEIPTTLVQLSHSYPDFLEKGVMDSTLLFLDCVDLFFNPMSDFGVLFPVAFVLNTYFVLGWQ